VAFVHDIDADRPRKILTLDGGGVRGALSVEVLARIEEIARQRGADTLSDYFDYISGTSTGAILAAGLSLGWSVERLRTFYETRAEEMFDKSSLLRRLHHFYDAEPLSALLREEIGQEEDGSDVTLGSPRLKTLLMMVMRNATTDSPWPMSNNPRALYNDRSRADVNLAMPLWQLVRASTAAPVYFPPECVRVGEREFLFVDGGLTCYNNPSFHTFLMATSAPYRLGWPTGEQRMLLVSVGTGTNPTVNAGLAPGDMSLLYNATTVPSALMFAAQNEQDFLCRTFGKCLCGDLLDREIGHMRHVHGAPGTGPVDPKLFTYVRYNADLTSEGLERLGVGDIDPGKVQKLDAVEGVPDLQRVGRAVAAHQVEPSHFDGFDA